jgi:hypothetical protein
MKVIHRTILLRKTGIFVLDVVVCYERIKRRLKRDFADWSIQEQGDVVMFESRGIWESRDKKTEMHFTLSRIAKLTARSRSDSVRIEVEFNDAFARAMQWLPVVIVIFGGVVMIATRFWASASPNEGIHWLAMTLLVCILGVAAIVIGRSFGIMIRQTDRTRFEGWMGDVVTTDRALFGDCADRVLCQERRCEAGDD